MAEPSRSDFPSRLESVIGTNGEDALIAGTVPYVSFPHPIVTYKVFNFLSARFPKLKIDEFIANLPNVLGYYFSLSFHNGGSRETLSVKMNRIAKAAYEFTDALEKLSDREYEMLQLSIGVQKSPSLPEVLAKNSQIVPSRLDQLDLMTLPLFTYRGASFLKRSLGGTVQNSKRPLREFIRLLLYGWLRSGFPQPKWSSEADAVNPDGIDQDIFCELVHLILDDLQIPDELGQVRPSSDPRSDQLGARGRPLTFRAVLLMIASWRFLARAQSERLIDDQQGPRLTRS